MQLSDISEQHNMNILHIVQLAFTTCAILYVRIRVNVLYFPSCSSLNQSPFIIALPQVCCKHKRENKPVKDQFMLHSTRCNSIYRLENITMFNFSPSEAWRRCRQDHYIIPTLPVFFYIIGTISCTLSLFFSDRHSGHVVPAFVITSITAFFAFLSTVWGFSNYKKHCCYPTLVVPFGLASTCFIFAMQTYRKAQDRIWDVVGYHLIIMMVVTLPLQLIAIVWMVVHWMLVWTQKWKKKFEAQRKAEQLENDIELGTNTDYITETDTDFELDMEAVRTVVEEVETDGEVESVDKPVRMIHSGENGASSEEDSVSDEDSNAVSYAEAGANQYVFGGIRVLQIEGKPKNDTSKEENGVSEEDSNMPSYAEAGIDQNAVEGPRVLHTGSKPPLYQTSPTNVAKSDKVDG